MEMYLPGKDIGSRLPYAKIFWNLSNVNPLYKMCPLDQMIDPGPGHYLPMFRLRPLLSDHASERD